MYVVMVGWPWCLVRGLGWGVRPTEEVEGGSRKFVIFFVILSVLGKLWWLRKLAKAHASNNKVKAVIVSLN